MLFNSKVKFFLTSYQKKWFIIILSLTILLVLYKKANSIQEDPYLFNMLRLNINFEYENYTYEGSANKNGNKTIFQELYNLNIRGKLKDRRIATYDIGVEFIDKTTTNTTTSKELIEGINRYTFKTNILPKSRIPLNLFANRDSADNPYSGNLTTDDYGLDWSLQFKTLPNIHLMVDNSQTYGAKIDTETTSYGADINMNKYIGPTSNSIGYSINNSNTTDNIGNNNSGTESSTIIFNNNTELPAHTELSIGITKTDNINFSKNTENTNDAIAGSINLYTIPTQYFNQKFDYTFVKANNAKQSMDNQSFAGGLNYSPITRLTTSLQISSYEYDSNTSAKETLSENTNILAKIVYLISKEWSNTESLSYKNKESKTSNPLTGKTKQTIMDFTSALKYNKPLEWAAFSAGTALGYYEETVEPKDGGEGVSYGFDTGLAGIKLTYLVLSTNYSFSRVEALKKGQDKNKGNREEQTFQTDANSSYISTLPVNASYAYHTLNSFVESEDGEDTTITAGTSLYFLKYFPPAISYSRYNLYRPGNVQSDKNFLFIKEQEEDTLTVSTPIKYLKYLPIISSYSHNTIYQLAEPPADAEYRYIKDKEEDEFKIDANLSYLKYLPVVFTYRHHILNQPNDPPANARFLYIKEKEEDETKATASLTYFKSTPVTAFISYKDYTQLAVNKGVKQRNTDNDWGRGINVSHSRWFLAGKLTLSIGYSVSFAERNGYYEAANTTLNGYYTESTTTSINGSYSKRLSRNIQWNSRWEQSDTMSNDLHEITTIWNTAIFYRLRQWLVSGEYTSTNKEDERYATREPYIEKKWMLKVTRSLIRIW